MINLSLVVKLICKACELVPPTNDSETWLKTDILSPHQAEKVYLLLKQHKTKNSEQNDFRKKIKKSYREQQLSCIEIKINERAGNIC